MTAWTPERRAAQAARLRATRPWEKSTGPRTPAGKARSSQNARKHGHYSAAMRDLFYLLRLQRELTRALRDSPHNNQAARIRFRQGLAKIGANIRKRTKDAAHYSAHPAHNPLPLRSKKDNFP